MKLSDHIAELTDARGGWHGSMAHVAIKVRALEAELDSERARAQDLTARCDRMRTERDAALKDASGSRFERDLACGVAVGALRRADEGVPPSAALAGIAILHLVYEMREHALLRLLDDALKAIERITSCPDGGLGPWTRAEAILAHDIAADPTKSTSIYGVTTQWTGEVAENAERAHRTKTADSAPRLLRQVLPWVRSMTELLMLTEADLANANLRAQDLAAQLDRTRAERDALQRHYDAASPEHNLLALLDLYDDRRAEIAAREPALKRLYAAMHRRAQAAESRIAKLERENTTLRARLAGAIAKLPPVVTIPPIALEPTIEGGRGLDAADDLALGLAATEYAYEYAVRDLRMARAAIAERDARIETLERERDEALDHAMLTMALKSKVIARAEATERFMHRVASGGTIVSSNALTSAQIVIARSAERMHVTPDGFGFVYIPGPLSFDGGERDEAIARAERAEAMLNRVREIAMNGHHDAAYDVCEAVLAEIGGES